MVAVRMEFPRKRGTLFVLSGPSGVGKNTILARILDAVPDIAYSVSATTRKPRQGELDRKHYFFLDNEEFTRRASKGEFLETAEFCGNMYGTPRAFVEERLDQGQDVILDIEIRGAAQIREALPEAVLVFLMPPSLTELRARIERRGKDSSESVETRMQTAVQEMAAVMGYDYVILNNDLDAAVQRLKCIIAAERSKVARCACEDFVRELTDSSKRG